MVLSRRHKYALLSAATVVSVIYWPGLSGGWLFDDYPNIVDNHSVQPANISISSLVRAALSSPSSELKRPLASLSFALNYLAAGLDPYWMKLTNLIIHLLNGLLVFVLARMLLQVARPSLANSSPQAADGENRANIVAILIATSWMLLPINLTAVLYVVQRMESMANLLVLGGLIGYVAGRCRMLGLTPLPGRKLGGLALCATSLVTCTIVGMLAKETAVMLPLYAYLIEWAIFRFRHRPAVNGDEVSELRLHSDGKSRDWRIAALFMAVLVLPMLMGLAWLLPNVLNPSSWATRDFTVGQRLLSETRVICDYITWTLLPTPHALSFYHDQFLVSTGLLKPWTTLASIVVLITMTVLAYQLQCRQPLAALGLALFLGCQLLTGTILPLELVYEHRNYFASFGLLLVVVPWLAEAVPMRWKIWARVVLIGLMLWWTGLTTTTAYSWGNPLRLAEDLAARAPDSPRAQYELGRTYIMYSHYNPTSPYTKLAYAPLERAAAMPESSILPQQALIFMNSRMHLPLKIAWWSSMITKLKARKPGVQDESALGALTQCARDHNCDLPRREMVQVFLAALSHPHPSARLLSSYSDYAWNVLGDRTLGLRMAQATVEADPNEPVYHITLARMLIALDRTAQARQELQRLLALNVGGRLDDNIVDLRTSLARAGSSTKAKH